MLNSFFLFDPSPLTIAIAAAWTLMTAEHSSHSLVSVEKHSRTLRATGKVCSRASQTQVVSQLVSLVVAPDQRLYHSFYFFEFCSLSTRSLLSCHHPSPTPMDGTAWPLALEARVLEHETQSHLASQMQRRQLQLNHRLKQRIQETQEATEGHRSA